jgi:hypothetical protein
VNQGVTRDFGELYKLIYHQLNLAIDLQTADTEDTVIRWCNYPPIAHLPDTKHPPR